MPRPADASVTHQRSRGGAALRYAVARGATRLVDLHQAAPMRILFPDPGPGEAPLAALVNTAGGMAGGDSVAVEVTLDPGAHAVVSTPAAEKIYRSLGPETVIEARLSVGAGATLEWLPQDTILFPGANAAIQTVFHLTSASRLLAWDLLCLGRPVMQETFSHGMLQNRLEVWRDGLPLLIERLILQEGNLSGVAHHPWVGTLLCYPANEHMLEGTRERLMALGDYAGATLNDSLLTIRFLANDNLVVQRVMRDIWQFLRPLLTHKTPVLPRIWQT